MSHPCSSFAIAPNGDFFKNSNQVANEITSKVGITGYTAIPSSIIVEPCATLTETIIILKTETVSVSSLPSSSLELSSSSSNSTSFSQTQEVVESKPSEESVIATAANIAFGFIATSAAGTSLVKSSPALYFGVARLQAMVNFVQFVSDGKCGVVDSEKGVPAADSPTQLSIGSSKARYYVGGVVGNFVLSFLLIALMQIGGMVLLKYFKKSSDWNRFFPVFAESKAALMTFGCTSLLLARFNHSVYFFFRRYHSRHHLRISVVCRSNTLLHDLVSVSSPPHETRKISNFFRSGKDETTRGR